MSEDRRQVLGLLSGELARRYQVVPWRLDGEALELLAVEAQPQLVDDLAFVLGREVRLVATAAETVRALLQRHYAVDAGDASAGREAGAALTATAQPLAPELDLAALAAQAPVVQFVNLVLSQAIRDQASDIHFEPFEHEFRIRYRIDGALYDMEPPPRELALPICSRLKVMAHLDIAEKRIAQDGRISFMQGARPVDLRVSTLPTQFGESVVLRVLDQAAVQLDVSQLGMPEDVYQALGKVLRRPNGIFVVTGPTGSGKTTTLYASLRAISSEELKLLTAEDPVEYEIDGIMQVPVNAPIGLSFAAVLRSFLRHDPDVIMVGEIRDLETAQVAIQAALTGHLVLSTLHTNDAPGALTRLTDMGVEPFLINSTLAAVLAQRLLRKLCPHCKTAYQPSAALLAQAGIDSRQLGGRPFYRSCGCPHCHNTGYLGRLGIFEWLPVSEEIEELVLMRAPTLELRKAAQRQGMRTLRDDGLRAVLAGQTSLEELLRYT